MESLKNVIISGREVLPLVEGGKGISISNGESSGAWAAAGGVGTFSAVNIFHYYSNKTKKKLLVGTARQAKEVLAYRHVT